MKLYLMRHGEASNMASSDHERPLTATGITRTEQAAQALVAMQIDPTVLYSSPRVRAQQTAEIVAAAFSMAITTRDELDFEFDVAKLRILMDGLEPDDSVFCVGHNPSMSEVVRELTGANIGLKKGGVVCIDLVPAVIRGAELVWLATPKVFGALHKP